MRPRDFGIRTDPVPAQLFLGVGAVRPRDFGIRTDPVLAQLFLGGTRLGAARQDVVVCRLEKHWIS